jgi:hypothetical protein
VITFGLPILSISLRAYLSVCKNVMIQVLKKTLRPFEWNSRFYGRRYTMRGRARAQRLSTLSFSLAVLFASKGYPGAALCVLSPVTAVLGDRRQHEIRAAGLPVRNLIHWHADRFGKGAPGGGLPSVRKAIHGSEFAVCRSAFFADLVKISI